MHCQVGFGRLQDWQPRGRSSAAPNALLRGCTACPRCLPATLGEPGCSGQLCSLLWGCTACPRCLCITPGTPGVLNMAEMLCSLMPPSHWSRTRFLTVPVNALQLPDTRHVHQTAPCCSPCAPAWPTTRCAAGAQGCFPARAVGLSCATGPSQMGGSTAAPARGAGTRSGLCSGRAAPRLLWRGWMGSPSRWALNQSGTGPPNCGLAPCLPAAAPSPLALLQTALSGRPAPCSSLPACAKSSHFMCKTAAVGLLHDLTGPGTAAMKQWHGVAWLLCSTSSGTAASSQTLCLLQGGGRPDACLLLLWQSPFQCQFLASSQTLCLLWREATLDAGLLRLL